MKQLPLFGTEGKVGLSPEFVYGEAAHKRAETITFEDHIQSALKLKDYLGIDWKFRGNFPSDFQNYVAGWNIPDSELENKTLRFLNLDLAGATGCSRRCAHCYTMEGKIDELRGIGKAQKLSHKELKLDNLLEVISSARDLGLKSVRVMGRGEPMECRDLVPFVAEMDNLGLTTVIFTRGHVLGDDHRAKSIYGSYGLNTGLDIANYLFRHRASLIVGYSSLDDTIHDGMVGISGHAVRVQEGIKTAIQAGFLDRTTGATRLAIQTAVTKLNLTELPIGYTLWQRLGASPVYNSLMVTGRSDEEFFHKATSGFEERVDIHAQIVYSMIAMGIVSDKDITKVVGAYMGTKKCHDIEQGLYLTSAGIVFPCPVVDSPQTALGDVNQEGLKKIWEINPYKSREQHICEPKRLHGFPNNFADLVAESIELNKERYQKVHEEIHRRLGV